MISKVNVFFALIFISSNCLSGQDEFLKLVNRKLDENEKIISILKQDNKRLSDKLSYLLAKERIREKKISKYLAKLNTTHQLLRQKELEISHLISVLNTKKIENKELKNRIVDLENQLAGLIDYNQKNNIYSSTPKDIEIQNSLNEKKQTRDMRMNLDSIKVQNGDSTNSNKSLSSVNGINSKTLIENKTSIDAQNTGEISNGIKERNRRKKQEETWERSMKLIRPQKSSSNLRITNNCHETILVAFHYLDYNENWVTEGWWEITSYSTIKPRLFTENSIIYIFAKSTIEDSYIWDGSGKTGSIKKRISSDRFIRLNREDTLYPLKDVQLVSFTKIETGSYSKYTYTYNCDK